MMNRRLHEKLDSIAASITTLRQEIRTMSSAFETALATLTTQVQANTDAEASAVALIQGLAAQIAAEANDPAAVTALAAKLKSSADALGAAVVANTSAGV